MPRNSATFILNRADEAKFKKNMLNLDKLPRGVKQEVYEEAEVAAATARKLAPVKTGRLKKGIEAKKTARGALIESEAPYSGYVEYGTHGQRPQSFFRPAIRKFRRNLRKKINQLFKLATKK